MEDNKEVTAEWANKIATTKLGMIAEKQLQELFSKIRTAATSNKFNISCATLEDIAKKELENRGFKIKWYDGDQRDPRDCGYFTISW